MLQLYDAHAGRAAPVRPARPGELRVWVAGPPGPRPCLLADLIRRVAQRHHLRVGVWQQDPAAWDELNIHPIQHSGTPPDPLDVAIAPAGQPAALRLEPGPAEPGNPGTDGLDPLALRLALLGRHYRAPVALDRPGLQAAEGKLRRWRELVAGWALSPSQPMSAPHLGDALTALDTDLDTPAAIGVLAALATDPQVPPGAKFETFAYLDQFLGLDLAREVGR